ncbi:hypothetical protein KIN20_030591, partial [Parelaphostrongylus tenuis]
IRNVDEEEDNEILAEKRDSIGLRTSHRSTSTDKSLQKCNQTKKKIETKPTSIGYFTRAQIR